MKRINNKQYALTLLKKVFGTKNGAIVSIEPIHNGFTNFSFVVIFENKMKYQVRLPHDGEVINRKIEYYVTSITNDQTFVYFDKKTGIAIKKWIEGQCPVIPTNRKWKYIDQLFTLIKKIHSLKLNKNSKIKPISFSAYNKHLNKLDSVYRKEYLKLLNEYSKDILVLNHTDINALNMILDNKKKLHLIDYEWAGLAPDYWDYANFIRESNILFKDINWEKYIKNFNKNKLINYIFISSVYAYLWTWVMPQTKKILNYRITTFKQVKKWFKGVKHE